MILTYYIMGRKGVSNLLAVALVVIFVTVVNCDFVLEQEEQAPAKKVEAGAVQDPAVGIARDDVLGGQQPAPSNKTSMLGTSGQKDCSNA